MNLMLTDWAIIGVLAVISVFDVIAAIMDTPTISNRFRVYGKRLSFLPYMWGVLAGHFWGPHMEPLVGNWWISIGALILFGALISGIHLMMSKEIEPPGWLPLAYVPLGIAPGICFWPQ